jgi:hypothetical protein
MASDKARSSNERNVVLAFKHLDFNCHLDFGKWVLIFGIYLELGF